MPMPINSNIPSLFAQRALNKTDESLRTSMQRLSSAKRINSARDDAAGLAIVERMTAQILGTQTGMRNANDGVSLAQVAEGALQEASSSLQRIRELAVQSINATNSPADRQALQAEAAQLLQGLQDVATQTNFNGQKILDGSFGTAMFQVGPNVNNTIAASTANFQTDQYGDNRIEGAASSVGTTGRITAPGSVTVTSTSGAATVNYGAGDSAQSVADSINQSTGTTGVKASAQTEAVLSFGAAGNYVLNVGSSDGSSATVSFSINAASGVDALSQAASAINDFTQKTGVVAAVKADGSGVTLSNYQGANITVSDTATANAGSVMLTDAGGGSVTLTADAVADSAVATGSLTLNADKAFSATGVAGDVFNSATQGSQVQQVAGVDISSVSGAKDALAVVDTALANVDAQRAAFGALQSRFESTVRNGEINAINLQDSRSRIQDADYAKETVSLARALLMKKAGMASLVHSNMTPQLALGLLQGSR